MIASSLREVDQLGRVIGDWKLFALMEIRASAAKTKTNTQLIRSKRDCLWVGLALPAGLKWSYKEIVSGNKRSVNQCNENTYLKDLDL